jgi:hypothetical protein
MLASLHFSVMISMSIENRSESIGISKSEVPPLKMKLNPDFAKSSSRENA